MATLTVYPDAYPGSTTIDGRIRTNSKATWTGARDASSGDSVDLNQINNSFGAMYDGSNYHVYRGFLLFDTSALGAGATINSAVFSFYNIAGSKSDDDITSMHLVSSNPASNTTLVVADFSTRGSTSFGSKTIASVTLDAYNDITLNASGLAAISKTGITKFALINSLDLNNVAPTGQNYINSNLASASGTANDPKLVIDYTPASTFTPKIMIF